MIDFIDPSSGSSQASSQGTSRQRSTRLLPVPGFIPDKKSPWYNTTFDKIPYSDIVTIPEWLNGCFEIKIGPIPHSY